MQLVIIPSVQEDGHSHLMQAFNSPMVQCAIGQSVLTAVVQFAMRWIPDQSVVRTLTVRILALMSSALMLTAPQTSTVLTPAKKRLLLLVVVVLQTTP